MNEFRSLLTDAVDWDTGHDEVALLFSGGTDSCCVLWSLIDCGVSVHPYTFYLEGRESADILAAREAADAFNLRLTEIEIAAVSTSQQAVGVARLVRKIGTGRKTVVECCWPLWCVAQLVEERLVFTGLNADDLWGSSAHDSINFRNRPDEFRAWRRDKMDDERTSAWCYLRDIFLADGMTLISPFRHHAVIEWFLSHSWEDLNRPRQKQPAIDGYADYYHDFRWRKNDNLQCGSGVREYMARMLDDESVNTIGAKRITDLYRSWL